MQMDVHKTLYPLYTYLFAVAGHITFIFMNLYSKRQARRSFGLYVICAAKIKQGQDVRFT